jgi:hypothetical protein
MGIGGAQPVNPNSCISRFVEAKDFERGNGSRGPERICLFQATLDSGMESEHASIDIYGKKK